jgi:site-specific DNA recombinase
MYDTQRKGATKGRSMRKQRIQGHTGRHATAAIGYVRVSTQEQADHGISLDAQEARIRAYATMRDLDLVAVVMDAGVSAGKYTLEEREGGQRVLAEVHRGEVRHVIALKLDRLFRNTIDCLTTVQAWDKAGVSLHLVDMGGASLDTASAMGRMFLTMAAGFAEMERNLTAERTAAALARKREKGEKTGGSVPFGYTVQAGADGTRRLVPEPQEQAALTLMQSLHSQGYSLRAIVAELDHRGMPAKDGGRWHPKSVARILGRVAL